jgi:cell division protease FtsH
VKLWSKLAVVVLAIVVMAGLFALAYWLPGAEQTPTIAYWQFMEQVDQNAVSEVTIDRRQADGSFSDGKKFRTTLPDDPSLINRLLEHRVRVDLTEAPGQSSSWTLFLLMALPVLVLFIGAPILLRFLDRGRGAEAMGFGRSRAKLLAPGKRRMTLADVAGIDEAEEELKEIVEFLKNPEKFQRLGGKMPKGCLLIGPPGTGKTLLARAIAGEANVPFYTISGSDFVEMFVGVGAARVRDMFAQAKASAPCIVFVDELDAVGRRRGLGSNPTNDEREQTLNQLLVEMDGFDSSEGIILLAATNRPDILDPALLRPGRFDRQIVLTNPDVVGRQQILDVHLRGVPIAPDVDVAVLARGTPGFSGADLANLVNEAALLAARRGNRLVTMAEFEQSKDKVLMGLERRSVAMSEKEKRTTAYHEAGHALVTFYTPGSDPLHKVTIVPRGRTLGITMSLPERDRYGFAKSELEAKIAVMFGGRATEEMVFGPDNVTTGAADDIRQATELARRMVVEYGFSTRLGPLNYSDGEFAGVPGPYAEHPHGFQMQQRS